jgi:hypothetical protein
VRTIGEEYLVTFYYVNGQERKKLGECQKGTHNDREKLVRKNYENDLSFTNLLIVRTDEMGTGGTE